MPNGAANHSMQQSQIKSDKNQPLEVANANNCNPRSSIYALSTGV